MKIGLPFDGLIDLIIYFGGAAKPTHPKPIETPISLTCFPIIIRFGMFAHLSPILRTCAVCTSCIRTMCWKHLPVRWMCSGHGCPANSVFFILAARDFQSALMLIIKLKLNSSQMYGAARGMQTGKYAAEKRPTNWQNIMASRNRKKEPICSAYRTTECASETRRVGSGDDVGGGGGTENMHAAAIALASFQNKSRASFSFRASNGPMILHFFIEHINVHFRMDSHFRALLVCSFAVRRLHIFGAGSSEQRLFTLPCLPLRKVTHC